MPLSFENSFSQKRQHDDGRAVRSILVTAVAMLSCKSRWWGNHDDDDSKEEVVEVDDNNETMTTFDPSPPATTDPSPPWRIHPPRPSPVSPVGWGDAWRRRQRRLGRRGGAAQVEADWFSS